MSRIKLEVKLLVEPHSYQKKKKKNNTTNCCFSSMCRTVRPQTFDKGENFAANSREEKEKKKKKKK